MNPADELDEIAGGLTVACEAQVPQVEQAVERLQAIAREMRHGEQGGRFHAARASSMLGDLQSLDARDEAFVPGLLEAIAHASTAQALAATPPPPFPPDIRCTGKCPPVSVPGFVNGDLSTFVAEQLVAATPSPTESDEDRRSRTATVQRNVQRALDAWAGTVQP